MSLDRPYWVCRVFGAALIVFAAWPCFANADAEDYERGMKVLEEARQQRDFERRDELLDEAESVFRTFLKENPDHSSAYSARSHIGNILVERARMQTERAQNTNGNGQAEARRLYQQAHENFETLEAELKVVLSRFGGLIESDDREKLARRQQLRANYLQAQLLMAAVLEESADTYDAEDAKRLGILEKAADEYREISQKYRFLLAGQYAQLYRGRCMWKCGRCEEALECLGSILDQPDVREFTAVKTKALSLALECWLDDSQKQYQQAAIRGDEWLKKFGDKRRESRDWLGIQFRLARAHRLLAESLDDDQQKIAHREKARTLAQFVAGREGAFQVDARKLLEELEEDG
jgi:hypothetical protein